MIRASSLFTGVLCVFTGLAVAAPPQRPTIVTWDMLMFLGSMPAANAASDYNNDGVVDIDDVADHFTDFANATP